MTIDSLVKIFGDGYFKLCKGKKAIDGNLYNKQQAQAWIEQGGQVGLWCPAGFIIIDIDDKEQAEILNKLTNTLKCKTPHGMHFYFKTTEQIAQMVKGHTPIGLKIDTRTAGKGYCVLPFNCDDRSWVDGELENLPYWIKPLHIPAKSPDYISVGAKDGDGRNDSLIRQIMRLRKEKYKDDEIIFILNLINNYVFAEPLPESEIQSLLSNAKNYTPFSSGDQDFGLYNSQGNLVGINHKGLIDYMISTYPMFTLGGIIYFYKDGVFKNNTLAVKDIIKTLIQHPKYQKQSQINEIFNLLMDDVRLCVTDKNCNTYKNFINFKNGMFDIETQILYDHDPRYMSTIQIPHEYHETDCDLADIQLMDFLMQTKLKRDDIEMILNYIAYCMTTQNGMKCFMCLVGGSNTGKSTLIKMINSLIGSNNISSLSIQDMAVRFYPAQLKDKLVNSCADNSSLALNDIGNLKKITGDDEIMYEDKGCKPYFFTPFSKLLFSFNTLPLQLEDKSDAFYNRMRILEMNVKISLTQQYVDDLCSEENIEAIIPILCKRLKNLRAIKPSMNSKKLVEQLRDESDSIHYFITKKLEFTGDYKNVISASNLYEDYNRFCTYEEMKLYKRKLFFKELEDTGLKPYKQDGKDVYIGIKVREV